MILNITYDPSVGGAPAGFVTALNAVVSFFQSTFTDSVTVNIDVGYGEVDSQPLDPNALGESITFLSNYSYAQIKSALMADAKSADDTSAVASLPASDPIAGSHFYWVSTAEAKALGLPASFSPPDGFFGFSDEAKIFDYQNTNGGTAWRNDF